MAGGCGFQKTTLPQKHHLLGALEVIGFDLVEIDAGCDLSAAIGCAVPGGIVISGAIFGVDNSRYFLTENVEDADIDLRFLRDSEFECGIRIERIGIVLTKLEYGR